MPGVKCSDLGAVLGCCSQPHRRGERKDVPQGAFKSPSWFGELMYGLKARTYLACTYLARTYPVVPTACTYSLYLPGRALRLRFWLPEGSEWGQVRRTLGAKSASWVGELVYGLNRLRKKSSRERKPYPQGLKPD